MDLLQSVAPVTLVVKAPNQKIADLTVQCAPDWTIKKLKEHLSSVYPNKPEEHEQRIIYSGKLLQDHIKLKDVLRKFDPDQTIHTVHLVCSTPELNQATTTHTVSSPDSMSGTEGVRHRRVQNSTESTSNSSSTVNTPPSQSSEQVPVVDQAYYGAGQYGNMGHFTPPHSAGMIPSTTLPMTPPINPAMMAPHPAMIPGFGYSPEQMMWLQQMYAQQMAQYMQYYQAMNQEHADTPANQNAAPQAQPANHQPAAPERNPPMVMNAAGDAVMDDDDEIGNRDWLDWLYTISRFVVLLSIVYFYSTFSRFMLVVGAFFFLYLYQAGWFQLRRDARNRPQEPQRRNEQENQQNAENVRREEDHNTEEDNSSEEPTSDPNSTPDLPVNQPGPIRIAWSFVSSFFTSLIPQPPPPVNLN